MYDMFMGVEHNPRISEWSAQHSTAACTNTPFAYHGGPC